ncbi:MAG TPA: YlbF family regulator [Bacillota bacterium]|nr:YlbF family regulator [Bacillota bacterium]
MKPLDLAKELAKSIASSTEYLNYKSAKEKLETHEAAKLMFDDFRKKQLELQRKKLSGEKALEPLETEIRKLTEVVSLNLYVRDFLMAEYQFSKMMMDVQKTLSEAVDIKLPEEFGG